MRVCLSLRYLPLIFAGAFFCACSRTPVPDFEETEMPDRWFRGHEASGQETTIWVAIDGNDEADGTREAPLKTIARAIEQARPGDIVQVGPGNFPESIRISKSGETGKPLTIQGTLSAAGEKLTFLTTSVPLDPAAWQAAPEIGPNVYRYGRPPDFPVALLTASNQQIGRIHDRAGDKRQYTAMEVLAWKDDVVIPARGMKEGLAFWPTMQAVSHFQTTGKDPSSQTIYVRFHGGTTPAGQEMRAYPSGAAIRILNASHVVVKDAVIAGGNTGVEILGKEARFNEIRNCTILHGTDRLVISGGASRNVVRGCVFHMAFYGPETGAWAVTAGEDDEPAAATKWFIYQFYKYWASAASISDDRSIKLSDCHDNLIWQNELDGGLIGLSLERVSEILIQENKVTSHSSVGTVIRSQATQVQFDRNHFENNNINFRAHELNSDSGRVVYLTNNISMQPPGLGNHIYCHVLKAGKPIAAENPAKLYILQNSFLGGLNGIILPAASHSGDGLDGFVILNNIFAVAGQPVYGQRSLIDRASAVGLFDYNLIVREQVAPLPSRPWMGAHNVFQQAGPAGGQRPQTGSRQAGYDLRGNLNVHGKTLGPIPQLTRKYFPGEHPDIGAIRN